MLIYVDPPGDILETYRHEILNPTIHDKKTIDQHKRTLDEMYPGGFPLEDTLLTNGQTDIQLDAIHCIVSSYHKILKRFDYRWLLLFSIGEHTVVVHIQGEGKFEEYKAEWEEVIKSIRLVEDS